MSSVAPASTTGLTSAEAERRAASSGTNAIQDVAQNPVRRALGKLWAPALLAGQQLYDLTAKSNLTSSSPKEKVSLGAVWTLGDFSFSLRETIYGPSYEWNSPDGGAYYKNEVKTAAITDLEASYSFTDYLKLTFGANNLFDKNPETIGLTPSGSLTTGNTALYDNPNPYSPYGTNGGYYYVKVSTKF